MLKRILVITAILAIVLGVGLGGYYIVSQKKGVSVKRAPEKIVDSKEVSEGVVSKEEKKKIIKQIHGVLENRIDLFVSDDGIEYLSEQFKAEYPGYIDISIIKFTPRNYILEHGYGVKTDLKKEKKDFEKLAVGSHYSGGIIYLGAWFYPFRVKKIDNIKFEIYDSFHKSGGAVARHYITFIKNYKIEIAFFMGIPECSEVKVDYDNRKIIYTQKGKKYIEQFEALIKEIDLEKYK